MTKLIAAFVAALALTLGTYATPACPTEDSHGCIWRADEQGNGEGNSFIARNTSITYLEVRND